VLSTFVVAVGVVVATAADPVAAAPFAAGLELGIEVPPDVSKAVLGKMPLRS
jgi:hypothetical protein